VLVNNAGGSRKGELSALPLEHWRYTFDLCLTSAFLTSQAVAQHWTGPQEVGASYPRLCASDKQGEISFALSIASKIRADGELARFEVHALSSTREPWQGGLFRQRCRNNLAAALPKGLSIEAMLWKERVGGFHFHERLIVTDLGGVAVDSGIDDGEAGETYVIRLLGKEESANYLNKHAPATSPYDLVEQERVTA
jgi:short chain dehydrogenase